MISSFSWEGLSMLRGPWNRVVAPDNTIRRADARPGSCNSSVTGGWWGGMAHHAAVPLRRSAGCPLPGHVEAAREVREELAAFQAAYRHARQLVRITRTARKAIRIEGDPRPAPGTLRIEALQPQRPEIQTYHTPECFNDWLLPSRTTCPNPTPPAAKPLRPTGRA